MYVYMNSKHQYNSRRDALSQLDECFVVSPPFDIMRDEVGADTRTAAEIDRYVPAHTTASTTAVLLLSATAE